MPAGEVLSMAISSSVSLAADHSGASLAQVHGRISVPVIFAAAAYVQLWRKTSYHAQHARFMKDEQIIDLQRGCRRNVGDIS